MRIEPFVPKLFLTNKITEGVRVKTQSTPRPREPTSHRKLLPYKSLKNVFLNCPWLAHTARKGMKQQLSHPEGFGVLAIAIFFMGGREWFSKHFVGWDKTRRDQHQIDSFVKTTKAPISCRALQERGVCQFKYEEQCMKARAYNGQFVSPSPIRFATRPINVAKHITSVLQKYGVSDE